jgi:hypothetical protein
MATFLPNVTDNLTEPYLFDADFNRIDRLMYQRENLYKQGAQKVKNLYESAFNSPMLRDSNIQNRDAYLKTINDGLKKVSAMDLSLLQNQHTAESLFEPVVNDKNILHDIRYTRQLYSGMNQAESYKSSTDPATRKMYWETGVKAMQYQAEDYKKADPNAALGMAAPKYTPNVNLLDLAQKAYKDAGISVKQDMIKGGYKWSMQNGTLAIPVTQSYIGMMFSSDPAVQDMLKTQAYVERKDFVKQNAFKYGNEDAAEKAYINIKMSSAASTVQASADVDDDNVKNLRKKKESWDKIISTRGIVPDSQEHEDYLTDLSKLQAAEQTANYSRNSIMPQNLIDPNNMLDMRNAVDNYVMRSYLVGVTQNIAAILASKNSEMTAKADDFALAAYRHQLSIKLEDRRHANALKTLQKRKELGLDGSNNNNDDNDGDDLFGGGNNNDPFKSNKDEDEDVGGNSSEQD